MEMDHDTDQRRDHKRRSSENQDKDGIPYKRRRPRIDNISIVSSASSSFPVASGLTNNTPITVSSFGRPSTLDHKDLGYTPESSGTSFMEAGKGFATDNLEYDACFGRIQVNAMLRTSLPSKSPELSVDPSGPLLKLSTTNPVKHVGIVMAPELSMLTQKFRVTLTATLSPTEYRHIKGEKKPTAYAQGSIRVLVYGFRSEQKEVAKVLSQGDLYLQDPFIGEIDSRVPYINPQYLLRPGSSMLEIAELLPSDSEGRQKSYDSLSETEKNRLLAIFQTETRAVDITAIQPSQRIRTLLKDHQLTALAFMIEKEVGNMNQPKFSTLWTKLQDEAGRDRYQHIVTGKCEEGYPVSLCGGILADEMGLGKTLTTLALVCWHLDSIDSQPRTLAVAESCMLRHSLVVAPKSTIQQWQKQIEMHLRPGSLHHLIYHGPNKHQTVPNWKSQDVILTSYDTIRSEWRRNGPLFRHSWARVILDEAHTVRNRTSKVFQAVCAIHAQRRWCLTGTPIHNRLDDFGALLSFIRVPPFFTRESFEMWITRPVKSKRNNALQTLRKLVLATCLRRTKPSSNGSLTLPQKTEKVEALVLDEEERALYSFFQRKAFSLAGDHLDRRSSSTPPAAPILPLIGTLRLICNHGQYLLSQKALSAWKKKDASRIDWNLLLSMVEKCNTCDMTADYTGDIDPIEFPCSHVMCATCSNANEADVLESLKHNCCPKCLQKENVLRFTAATQCDDSRTKSYYKASTKVKALVRNLRVELFQPLPAGKMNPFKSIVFSYWTKMLDLVMIALEINGFSFTRVDGRTSLPKRIQALDTFNNDPNCQIMLASIGSIGEGVDLTAANHVHILEPQWNPMTEAQAVDRIHRIGQERDVVITRYFIQNSIEDYVRFVQKDKLRLIEQSLSVSNTQQLQMEEVRWKVLLETLG